MSWFTDLAWWWQVIIFWGYFIVGYLFDLIKQKVLRDDSPAPLLWVLWPFVVILIIIFLPFIFLDKIFGKF